MKTPVDSLTTHHVLAKGDSAASHHYWRQQDVDCLSNLLHLPSTDIILPNASTIASSTKGHLPLLSLLTPKAKEALILPQLCSSSLISLGQLCNDGCTVTLDKYYLKVKKNNTTIMQGIRNFNDGLWDIPVVKNYIQTNNYISPPPSAIMQQSTFQTPSKTVKQQRRNSSTSSIQLLKREYDCLDSLIDANYTDQCINKHNKISHKANVILRKKQTHVDLIKYLHKACFSPTISTFSKAIKNNHFTSWPGLTVPLVTKHLPKSVATSQGHLTSERQGLQSTTKPLKTYVEQLKAPT